MQAARGETSQDESFEAQIAAIEAAFEAAQQRPVHWKNRALRPVEVLPGVRQGGEGGERFEGGLRG